MPTRWDWHRVVQTFRIPRWCILMTLIFHPEPSASAVLCVITAKHQHISFVSLWARPHRPASCWIPSGTSATGFSGCTGAERGRLWPHQKRQKLLSTRLRGEYATVLFLTDTETSRVKQHRADRAGPKSDTETSIKNPVDFQNKTPNANFQS